MIIPGNHYNVYEAVIMASHCKSSRGSFDECITSFNDLGCESANGLLPSTSTIAIYYYY